MDREAGLRIREKRSSSEAKVLRKCLKTSTAQIILYAEFASVYTVNLARREEEEGGRERREEWGKKRKICETRL